MSRHRGTLLLVLVLAAPALADDWPQWRGPNRDNVCKETGLLPEWPKDGPPLLWKAENIGRGFAPVTARDGRLYTLGFGEKDEYAVALDRGTGKEIWSTKIQEDAKQPPGMYWLSQRAPTVDSERLYAVTAFGALTCLEADRGTPIWRKDYVKDFGGKRTGWGYCDFPLIDGERLITTPGGPESKLVALERRTGDSVWRAAFSGNDVADYSPVQAAEIAGVRQYVQLLSRGIVGLDAKDGKLLWRFDGAGNFTINLATPIIRGDEIFCAGVYGKNNVLIRVKHEGDAWVVEEKYSSRQFQMDNWGTGPVRVGDELFLAGSNGQLFRVEWSTGTVKETAKLPFDRTSSVLYADGRLYVRGVNHTMTLVEIGPKELVIRGSFKIASSSKQGGWTAPVISGGKLFVRDQDELRCYDLRPQPLPLPRLKEAAPKSKENPSQSNTLLVPTPTDVVERMLHAWPTSEKGDVLADLGCGDGRIVVAAAKGHGCKAVGYEIDQDCASIALRSARQRKQS